VTFWDPEEDVCWLVGYHEYHAAGDRKDSYEYFAGLHGSGKLTPTADDYELLFEITPESLIQSLREYGPRLVEQARSMPGREVELSFVAGVDAVGVATITVDLVFEVDGSLEQGWVGIRMPENSMWPAGGAVDLAQALMPPEVASEDIRHSNFVGRRPAGANELAFSWSLDVTDLLSGPAYG